MDDLILTDEFEWFDQERYDRMPDEASTVKREFLPNGTYIKLQDLSVGSKSKEGEKFYTAIPKDSYFMLRKTYYPSGRIRSKGWAFTDFFEKGVWPNFDDGGNLTLKWDYDKPFTYTFDDVLGFCQRNNIKVSKSTGEWVYGFRTKIKRAADATGDICGWRIEYLKRDDLIEYIFLDGKTGEITGRKTMDYSPG